MLFDSIGVLVLALGAVLAMLGYLVMELGRAQEATLGVALDRELATAVYDPARGGGTTMTGAADVEDELLAAALGETEPYTYRPLPAPTPDSAALPGWLVRALARAGACHALDAEDQLVLFLRVPAVTHHLNSALRWACDAAPASGRVTLDLAFSQGRTSYTATVPFRLSDPRDLRHLIRLVQHEVVRVDFILQTPDHRLRHGGCRLVVAPEPVQQQVRAAVLSYLDQAGNA